MKIDYVEIKTKLADMEVMNCGFCYSLRKDDKEFRENIKKRIQKLHESEKLFSNFDIDFSSFGIQPPNNSASPKKQEETEDDAMYKYGQYKIALMQEMSKKTEK